MTKPANKKRLSLIRASKVTVSFFIMALPLAPVASYAQSQAAESQTDAPQSSDDPQQLTGSAIIVDFPLPINEAQNPFKIETIAKFNVHNYRAIDIPLKLLTPDLEQPDGQLWAKGDKPKNNTLASAWAVPDKTATITAQMANGQSETHRLVHAQWHDTRDSRAIYPQRGEIYCGKLTKTPLDTRIFCLIDSDDDQKFDQISLNMAPVGGDVYSSSIIMPSAPLQTPIAWHESSENKIKIALKWQNCGKDWDKPYFQITRVFSDNALMLFADLLAIRDPKKTINFLKNNQDHPYFSETMEIIAAHRTRDDLYTQHCRRTEAGFFERYHLPDDFDKKSYLTEMDGLIFAIDKKSKHTKTRLLGTSNIGQRYRLEGNNLVPLSIGHNVIQAKLATNQEFDRELLEFLDVSLTNKQARSGDELLRVDFQHGYTGELTRDVVIKTLFSSRSLPAGTQVYGFAGSASVSSNAYTDYLSNRYPKRKIEQELVWCVPVREETQENDQSAIKWSASCLASTIGNNHTLITDVQPPLAVSGLSFDVKTTDVDGAIPVKRIFDNPSQPAMQWRFFFQEIFEGTAIIRHESVLEGELVELKYGLIPAAGIEEQGKFILDMNAVSVELLYNPVQSMISLGETKKTISTNKLTFPRRQNIVKFPKDIQVDREVLHWGDVVTMTDKELEKWKEKQIKPASGN